jgi:hypothetical protein
MSASLVNIYDNSTKQICLCSFISIFLIILFIISPLSKFFKTSLLMKLITIVILSYTFYLSFGQTKQLKLLYNNSETHEIKGQLNMNIVCSYTFTLFIGLLIIFVVKNLI